MWNTKIEFTARKLRTPEPLFKEGDKVRLKSPFEFKTALPDDDFECSDLLTVLRNVPEADGQGFRYLLQDEQGEVADVCATEGELLIVEVKQCPA